MRTVVVSMLLVTASAAAEPARDSLAVLIDVTEVTVSGAGGVDPTIVARVFDETIAVAARCYDSVKSRPANLTATVTLQLRIDDSGAITKASAAGLPSVNNCLTTALKALVLGTPNKGAMDLTEKLWVRTPSPPPRMAGVLGSVTSRQGGAFASLTGTGDISSGFDDVNMYGGLVGSGTGDNHAGRGGARVRTVVPTVSIGQPGVQGDLDKAIIRRYIKRNLQKIQYCYEKQLLNKPRLAGTVRTQFTIGGDGKVTSSTGAGVDDEVASCVADVIRAIEFPKPKTNDVVTVSYPFVFQTSADDKTR